MKTIKTIIFCLVAGFSFSQVPSFTIAYFDAKPFQQDEIAKKFDDFYKDYLGFFLFALSLDLICLNHWGNLYLQAHK